MLGVIASECLVLGVIASECPVLGVIASESSVLGVIANECSVLGVIANEYSVLGVICHCKWVFSVGYNRAIPAGLCSHYQTCYVWSYHKCTHSLSHWVPHHFPLVLSHWAVSPGPLSLSLPPHPVPLGPSRFPFPHGSLFISPRSCPAGPLAVPLLITVLHSNTNSEYNYNN